MGGIATENHGRLIEEAERWAKVGERSFWNWYSSLSDADRAVVKRHMNRTRAANA